MFYVLLKYIRIKEIIMKGYLLFCIQLCINTYEGTHGKVKKITDTWKKNVMKNVEYYFGAKDRILHICFRGSDNSKESQKGLTGKIKKFFAGWKDWIQNLDTHSIDVDEGEMHLGFFEDHRKIERHCFREAEKYTDIIITGHSKGADQALLLYYFLRKRFPNKNVRCVAVAPAKCFCRRLAKHFQDCYFIMNGEDFICKIPQWKFYNVKKMKKFIHIGKKNFFFKIPLIRAGGVIDHYPQKYLENMKKHEKVIL
jgi:hypothetical protein